jgi:hypothetical protein
MIIHPKHIALLFLTLATLVFNVPAIQTAEADGFSDTSPMIIARRDHTATLLTNGQVLVVGGDDWNSIDEKISGPELYDPVTETWTTTLTWKAAETSPLGRTVNTAHRAHTATLLSNGQVLVAGGEGYPYLFAKSEIYDPASGMWKQTGDMTIPRAGHTATLLQDGKVLVTGGQTILPDNPSAELYDPITGKWTETGKMNFARKNHTATILPNGKVLVAGGEYDSQEGSSAELYDPASGNWTKTGPMKIPRNRHTATLLPNGKVLVTGGVGLAGGAGYGKGIINSAEIYDPSSGTWTLTAAMHDPRIGHTATLLPNGKVLVAGDQGNGFQNTVEIYDPTTSSWTTTNNMNTARAFQTATLLPNGKVLFAGGTQSLFSFNRNAPDEMKLPLFSAELFGSEAAKTNNATVVTSTAQVQNQIVPINLANSAMLPGSFRFSFFNSPKMTFTVVATTNISLALSNWMVIGKATEISSGEYQFTDTQATNYPQRFYRVRSP